MERRSAKSERVASRPDFVNPRLAAAMSHPTRVRVMSILSERIASPREMAAEMGEPLNNVTYHVNQLRGLVCAVPGHWRDRSAGRSGRSRPTPRGPGPTST